MNDNSNPFQAPGLETDWDAPVGQGDNWVRMTPQMMQRANLIHHGIVIYVRLVVMIIFSIVFIAGGLTYFFGRQELFLSVGLVAVGTFLLVRAIDFPNKITRTIRKQFQQMGKPEMLVQFTADENYIYVREQDSNVRIRYEHFCYWKEKNDLIIAYRYAKFYQVIPVSRLDQDTQRLIREGLATRSHKK